MLNALNSRCYSPKIVTVKVRGFVFKPLFAAQKANEICRRPQLEAGADFQKMSKFSNSV